MKIPRDSIITLFIFFLLVITFYFVGYWLIFKLGKATPLMLSVGLATVVTCLIRKKNLATLGWGWGSWGYQWMSYFLPLAIITISYLIIWLADFGDWYNSKYVLELKDNYNLTDLSDTGVIIFHFILTASISFIISLPSVLGEEIGWRGLLVPELSKFMSFTGVALTSGILWSIWHWPLMFKGIYGNSITPIYYQLFFFSLFIISTSVIMTYLRFKTNSLWTAVIFHMSSNIFLQKVFTPLTLENTNSAWYLDEFGAITPIVTFFVAIYFWRKAKLELHFNKLHH